MQQAYVNACQQPMRAATLDLALALCAGGPVGTSLLQSRRDPQAISATDSRSTPSGTVEVADSELRSGDMRPAATAVRAGAGSCSCGLKSRKLRYTTAQARVCIAASSTRKASQQPPSRHWQGGGC